jgi:hypothetical protein
MAVERETYQKSRAGLDLLYNELQKKYDDECLSKEVNTTIYFSQKRSFLGCGNRISITISTKE